MSAASTGTSWTRRAVLGGAFIISGALLSLWGTRAIAGWRTDDGPMLFMPADELCLPPEKVESAVAEGASLNTRMCAGCHDTTVRGVGPSYSEIVATYRRAADGRAVEGRVLSALARGTQHPESTWALTTDQRDALAYFMWRQTSAETAR